MPLTPFLGLSVIIHLGFIVSHRFFKFVGIGAGSKKSLNSGRSRLNFAIVMGIFMIVATSAFFLVKESLVEKHSSILLAERALAPYYSAKYVDVAMSALPANAKPAQKFIFGQVLQANTARVCTEPGAGNFVAEGYLASYGYGGLFKDLLNPAVDLKGVNLYNNPQNVISPRGGRQIGSQDLTLGVCAQIADMHAIN